MGLASLTTPEMRTPPLIRELQIISRVSTLENCCIALVSCPASLSNKAKGERESGNFGHISCICALSKLEFETTNQIVDHPSLPWYQHAYHGNESESAITESPTSVRLT